MRVAVLTTSYPASPEDACGHFVRAEALELAEARHDVHVIAPEPEPSTPGADECLHLWPLPHGGAFGWPGAASRVRRNPWRVAGAARFAALAMRRLRALRPERIVAHWVVPCAWPIALGSACDAEVHAIAHGADVRVIRAMPAVARQRLIELLLRRGVQLRFVAHALREELIAGLPVHLGESLRLASTVRPAALRLPDVRDRAGQIRSSCNAPLLATVAGRLVPGKRVELAIGAAGLLGGRMLLAVAGDGPEAGRLRANCGGAPVRFLGRLERRDALAWIAASDVLLHPSAVEAAPTVVREARSLGTRVVACACGDVARWADEDQGIMIAEPSAGAIARAVELAC